MWFIAAFNLAFGTQLEEYRDFVRTAVTLFRSARRCWRGRRCDLVIIVLEWFVIVCHRSMFGDSGYERLVRVNRFLAPVLTFLHLLSAAQPLGVCAGCRLCCSID